MNATTPRIAIIGAGPGGLTCARILQRHGVTATVHDRDSGPDARDQGGSLDLHEHDGQSALKEAGLLDEFLRIARPEGQEMRQFDAAAGTLVFHHRPAENELFKPEIDRGRLRALLLNSLAPETVHWNHALHSIEGPADGPRVLRFADGSVVEADLVIGADGAWSRVRSAVSSAVPEYTGISFLEAWFDDVDRRHPEIADLVGHGSAVAADGERALFAQRNSNAHIRVYIIQRVPERPGADRAGDTDRLRATLEERFRAWHPRLLRLLTDNDGPYVDRPLYALPVPHTWPTDPTVTLLGDAAHLMPPLGVGVNLAMLDAADLARAVATHATIADAIRAYEHSMVPRSHDMQARLDGRAADLLADDHPDADRIPEVADA